MAKFAYTALDVEGKERKGRVEAADVYAATAILREQGLFVVKINEGRTAIASGRSGLGNLISKNLSVSKRDLVFFFKQLAFMLRAGLPMLYALSISKTQFKGRLRTVIEEMIADIEAGSPLSTAMKKYKTDVFPPIVANMTLARESTGAIDAVMLRLGEHLEKKLALRSQTISAMIYPVIVVFAAIGVVSFLLGVIIPKFAAALDHILNELGAFYEERLEVGVKRMAALIEPALILVIGVIVGFVYYAFFMALFSLVK